MPFSTISTGDRDMHCTSAIQQGMSARIYPSSREIETLHDNDLLHEVKARRAACRRRPEPPATRKPLPSSWRRLSNKSGVSLSRRRPPLGLEVHPPTPYPAALQAIIHRSR